MFGFEFSHILVLAAIALIVLGPKQMPQLAKILGRTLGELRKAMRDVTSQITVNLEDQPSETKAPGAVKPQERTTQDSGVKKDQT